MYEKERMCGSMTEERKKMSPAMAMKLWKDFLMAECDGRETRTAWIRIDGSRICSKCGRDRRKKKLYVYWIQKENRTSECIIRVESPW